MKPVDQDLFGPPRPECPDGGNCLVACVASILELELAEVPHFCAKFEEGWWERMQAWLAPRGLKAFYYPTNDYRPPGYSIASGPSAIWAPVLHACVALDGAIVHDPNPGRQGLDVINDYIVIEPL